MTDPTIHPTGRPLTPYDTGDVLEPCPWRGYRIGSDADFGKVDFDNDEGFTVATVRAVRAEPGSSLYELHVDNMDPDGAPGEGIPCVSRVVIDGVEYVPRIVPGPWTVEPHPINLDGFTVARSDGDGDTEHDYRHGPSNGITRYRTEALAQERADKLNNPASTAPKENI